MQYSVLTTIVGLVAASVAMAAPSDSSLEKKGSPIVVTLCNDFHGGKPCETHNVYPGQCSNVDSNLYKYVSSVKIASANEYCIFWAGTNCNGKNIVVDYPGDKDLAVNDNFDNQILSYACYYT